jgi:acyl-CoA thioester hydrolase
MSYRVEIRPLYGDVDAMNVVYNGNYLRFFERGRAELMRSSGGSYANLLSQGLHLPVSEAGVKYLRPAHYDDPLVIETEVAWVKRASLQFDYKVLRTNNDHEELIAKGFTAHGCVDNNGRIMRLPQWVIEAARAHLKDEAGE